jgi:hypothetical protein
VQRARGLIEERRALKVERDAVDGAANRTVHQQPRGFAGGSPLVTLAGSQAQHREPDTSRFLWRIVARDHGLAAAEAVAMPRQVIEGGKAHAAPRSAFARVARGASVIQLPCALERSNMSITYWTRAPSWKSGCARSPAATARRRLRVSITLRSLIPSP